MHDTYTDGTEMDLRDSRDRAILKRVATAGVIAIVALVVLIVARGGWEVVLLLFVAPAFLGFLYIRYGLDRVDAKLEARKQRKLAKSPFRDRV